MANKKPKSEATIFIGCIILLITVWIIGAKVIFQAVLIFILFAALIVGVLGSTRGIRDAWNESDLRKPGRYKKKEKM